MTWNIHDVHGDPLAIDRVIRDAAADVVCLQEAPRFLATRHQLVGLARRTGMFFLTGGREAAGVAILGSLRLDVDFPHARRLPTAAGWRVRPHGYARATIGLPGTDRVSVTSFHLGTVTDWRPPQVRALLAGLLDEVPAVLAGDLNEQPGGPTWHALTDWAADPDPKAPKTFRTPQARHRIDAVLVDPRLNVEYYGDPPGVSEADVNAGSDHRPVFAAIRLPRRHSPAQDAQHGDVFA